MAKLVKLTHLGPNHTKTIFLLSAYAVRQFYGDTGSIIVSFTNQSESQYAIVRISMAQFERLYQDGADIVDLTSF